MSIIVINSDTKEIPSEGYIVKYREVDSTEPYKTVSPNPTIFPIAINVESNNKNYEIIITPQCSYGKGNDVVLTTNVNYEKVWVKDKWYCESITPFSVTESYKNYYSPSSIGYIDDKLWIVDRDAPFKIYYVSPSELTSDGGIKHDIPWTDVGDHDVYGTAIDTENKVCYFTGMNTDLLLNTSENNSDDSGYIQKDSLIYYDIKTNKLDQIPFGTNGIKYSKMSLSILKTKVIAIDTKGDGTVLLVNRKNLNDYSILQYSQIGTTNITGTHITTKNIWDNEIDFIEDNEGNIIVKQNGGVPYLAVYSSDLSTLKQIIDLSISLNIQYGVGSKYRTSWYYDNTNGNILLYDYGSSKIFKLGYDNGKYILKKDSYNSEGFYQIPKNKGVQYIANFKVDPITNELWLSGALQINETNIIQDSQKSYKIDKNTLQPIDFLAFSSITDMVRQNNDNILWGVYEGTIWNGSKDGLIFKIER